MRIATERSQLVFRKLERSLLKLESKQKPESVHAFRTATRRLQTLIEEFGTDRPRNEKKLLKVLERIRRRAGRVRDVDVQLTALRHLKTPQEPRRKTMLMHTLINLRAEYQKKLRKSLTKEDVREARKRLRRAAKVFQPSTVRDPLMVARQIMVRVMLPDRPVTEETMHRTRTLGKKARYAAEFAEKSPDADQFLASLKHAQDALGDWHDWFMLTQSAAKHLGDFHESPLVAVLHNLSRTKFRHAAAALSRTPLVAEDSIRGKIHRTKFGNGVESPSITLLQLRSAA
jgi:CHAD domain-containing protein